MPATAANLLIGSTCGQVYIVRGDPDSRTLSLKTTISAGEAPIQLLVDVQNKCFYCLDAIGPGSEGHLMTLAPTEFGTIEETMSIGTGASSPTHMMSVGHNIYVNHKDGYSIIKSPIVPKSTRRRRESTLAPVTEDSVAESLDELYAISKSMHHEDSVESAGEAAAPAIAAIEAHLYAESSIDVTELQTTVATGGDEDQILKFVEWAAVDDRFVVGVSRRSVTTYVLNHDGTPTAQRTVEVQGGEVVDCVAGQDSLFVLCRTSLKQGRLVDGALTLTRTWQLADAIQGSGGEVKGDGDEGEDGGTRSLQVLKDESYAFVLTRDAGVLAIDLQERDEDEGSLVVVVRTLTTSGGTSMALSSDNGLLFVADHDRDVVTMYGVAEGALQTLATCRVARPASIVQMS